MPFLRMTKYIREEDECELNLTLTYLVYIISLNFVFVILPMFLLTYLYICIIINTRKNYNSIKNNFNIVETSYRKEALLRSNYPANSTSLRQKNQNSIKLNSIHEIKETIESQNTNRRISFNKNETYNFKRLTITERLSKSSFELNGSNHANICKKYLKSTSTFSYESMLITFQLKAKKKHVSIAKISILTILSFCSQVPIRLFICWSYLSSYSARVGLNSYETFIENNYESISIYYKFSTVVYFLNFVFNSIIYNIFSAQFRKAFKIFFRI